MMKPLKNYISRGIEYILHGVPERKITANIVCLQENYLLQNRTALITGGTSGIGFEIAKSFASAGANVIITGRNEKKLIRCCEELRYNHDENLIIGKVMDNTDVKSFNAVFQDLCKRVGDKKIDILVNNAGITGKSAFGNTEEEDFDHTMATNLKGTFFLSQVVAKYMKQNHIEGNILNIASSSSVRPASSAYTLSKWGVRGLTEGLAKSLIPYGIVVNGIAPGPTATPMLIRGGETDNIAHPRNPMGRYAMPQEIANMAVILVSQMGRSIVGDIIYMTGGAGIITLDDVNYSF